MLCCTLGVGVCVVSYVVCRCMCCMSGVGACIVWCCMSCVVYTMCVIKDKQRHCVLVKCGN